MSQNSLICTKSDLSLANGYLENLLQTQLMTKDIVPGIIGPSFPSFNDLQLNINVNLLSRQLSLIPILVLIPCLKKSELYNFVWGENRQIS